MYVHHVRHQRGRLAGLPGLLVLPLIGLHPARHRDEGPFADLLRRFLALRSPHLHPLPQRVTRVLPLVGVPVEPARGIRYRERTRRVPVRCESEFRVLTGAALHAHAVAHCCPFRLMYRAGSMRSGTDSCRPERSVSASGGLPACLGRSSAVIGSRPAFAQNLFALATRNSSNTAALSGSTSHPSPIVYAAPLRSRGVTIRPPTNFIAHSP